MADTFGLKIGLEGEKEFKKALGEINQSFKVLGSEMKLVESQFAKNDNSADALAARHKVLTEQIDAQKQKIEMLKQALANSAESFGENDRRTQAWQIQLNNAQAALNGMERELADNESAMDELGKEMDDTGDSAEDLEEELNDAGDAADDSEGKFSKLGGTLKTVGVAMGACVAATAAAAVSLGKAVVEAYGEYEQLVGGIDTLFKDSSGKMQEYANNAYKTAGLSANDYMSTVTSFSASLISSLGGDTEAAVKYADMAITDMADNANKMGTDIGLIQNAYQGFAKQNYTMLDNLKLGYGGTKTEMERLIADANEYAASIGESSDLTIDSFADVITAIELVQEKQNIAGTTSREAMSTISGSVRMVQKAWENFLTSLGTGDASMITESMSGIFDGIFGAINEETQKREGGIISNVLPIVQNIGAAIISYLPTLANDIFVGFQGVFNELFNTLIPQLADNVITQGPVLAESFYEMASQAIASFLEGLPAAIDGLTEFIAGLIDGIGTSGPELFSAAQTAFNNIVKALQENGPAILESLGNLLVTIIQKIVENAPALLESAAAFFRNMVNAIVENGPDVIKGLWNVIVDVLHALAENAPALLDAAGEFFLQLVYALGKLGRELLSDLGELLLNIGGDIADGAGDLLKAGGEFFQGLFDGIKKKFDEIVAWVKDIPNKIKNALGNLGSLLVDAGKNILNGLLEGLQSAWTGITDFVGGIGDWIANNKGPKEYDLALLVPNGQWIMQSLEKGLKSGVPDLLRTISGITSEIETSMVVGGNLTPTSGGYGVSGETKVYNIYIDGTKVNAQGVIDVVDDLITQASRYAGMNLGGERKYAY